MDRVGVIGLGQMGLPIAKLLLKSGRQVVGFRRGDMSDFVEAGGMPATSCREVAESVDVVFSCLPSAEALAEVVSGPEGLLRATRRILLIEMSTLPPSCRKDAELRLSRNGATMLDCPISGTPLMVDSRSAVLFASGERAAFELAEPLLREITSRVFFFGPFGVGTRMKFCANLLVAVNLMAAAEAMLLGAAAGLDGSLIVSALRDSAGTSLQFQTRAPMMAEGRFDQALAPLTMLDKDLRLIKDLAADLGCCTPLLNVAARWYGLAVEAGYGECDAAAILKALIDPTLTGRD